MKELLVMDVANVYITDIDTGKILATTTTSANNVTATLEQDVLRAGFGGGIVATINSSKTVELGFTDVFFSLEYLALQQGTDVEEGATGTVLSSFCAKVEEDTTDPGNPVYKIAVPADVTATSGILQDSDGTQDPVTITGSEIILSTLPATGVGGQVTVHYEREITGQKVVIDSAKFPKYVQVQMHTRAFDPDTNTIVEDIYMKFNKCQPMGNTTIELGVNTPVPTEMSFTALNSGTCFDSTEIGEVWSVERPKTP